MRLREAGPSDAYTLWVWANDPETRAAVDGRAEIAWVTHVAWLASQLGSSRALVWIGELDGGQPAGTIRFDTNDNWGTARLSYTIASESRGRGLGREIVALGVARLRELRPGARVWADVRETNGRSRRIFERLRWRLERPAGGGLRAVSSVRIAGRPIGPSHPTYLVAELSGNHNGDLERAVRIVHAAAAAGADAVKLQTYRADTITIRSDRPDFIVPGDGPWAGRTLYDLYEEAHTPWDWHQRLFAEAHRAGLAIFSTPFDDTAVDFLETLDAPAYKVASFELVDDGLLRKVAGTLKPVILSTGMASVEEIPGARCRDAARHNPGDARAI